MIKILMCGSARTEKGGMNSVINQLMENNWDDELRFSYLATHKSGNTIKKALYFLNAYRKLKNLLKKDDFDIIHMHMSYKGSFYRKYYMAKLCKKYNKNIIIHLHGSEFKDFYNFGNSKRKSEITELFEMADYTIVLGEDWKKFVQNIAPNANAVVVSNAIHLPEIKEKQRNEICTLLFLGVLIKRKGVIDLLKALKNISLAGENNYKLLIAGSGEEEKNLREYCSKNSLNNNIEFIGWVDNSRKVELLNRSDVLVLPSYNEGLPIAVLEAIAYGLLVISTDVGSISEAVIQGKNGYLFKPGDIDALTDALKKVITDKTLWKTYSDASRQIAENKFSDECFFENIERIYNNIIFKRDLGVFK